MVMEQGVFSTDLPELKLHKQGKVRDIYEVGDYFLIVATDRISAFDVVLPNCIPHKGEVLTRLSGFWFAHTSDIIQNHLITCDVASFPDSLIPREYHPRLEGRAMLVRRAEPFPVECVVRGYLAGSGWKKYANGEAVSGIRLRAGYQQADKLDEPVFTPSTKAESGHDEDISIEKMENLIGRETARKLIETSLKIYEKAAKRAESRGIIIADTKFEFGVADGQIILIDELLTPDSSRFWPRDEYRPGNPQPSFDKQFVRDYLEGLDWDKTPPAPQLPEEIIQKTSRKYLQALELLAEGK
jgi:phosphoribosylaminoimidazole-succinocarboxamide synthase